MNAYEVPTLFDTATTKLSRGELTTHVAVSDSAPSDLYSVAERINPKRAFLFVSKVLGRHIPTPVDKMASTMQAIADKVDPSLPGPILVVGMAETAVALGSGVHRALSEYRDDVVFLSTTRHKITNPQALIAAVFSEPHSHLSTQYLYYPLQAETRDLVRAAKSVVVVDDEITTGNTVVNLIGALRSMCPNIQRTVAACITDWSNGNCFRDRDMQGEVAALLSGSFDFTQSVVTSSGFAAQSVTKPEMPGPVTAERDHGRLGTMGCGDTLITTLSGGKTLVIGTGEYTWKPFLLAERIAKSTGAEVFVSAITRSPINTSSGEVIQQKWSLRSPYGENAPYYLYNVNPEEYDTIYLCLEGDAETQEIDQGFIVSLSATTELVVINDQ